MKKNLFLLKKRIASKKMGREMENAFYIIKIAAMFSL
jgi:hypothetical protein